MGNFGGKKNKKSTKVVKKRSQQQRKKKELEYEKKKESKNVERSQHQRKENKLKAIQYDQLGEGIKDSITKEDANKSVHFEDDEEKHHINHVKALNPSLLCDNGAKRANVYEQYLKSLARVNRYSSLISTSQDADTFTAVVRRIIGPKKRKIVEKVENNEELDPLVCFICDIKHQSLERCISHMHREHGLFIPDREFLVDPNGLLTYAGSKVTREFRCLYCNDDCSPFLSLEAVRMHMVAKCHCKIRFGDGGDDEEVEFQDFYDYSSSYVDAIENKLVTIDDIEKCIYLGIGNLELVLKRKTEKGTVVKALGARELMRYYRQKPRPTVTFDFPLVMNLARQRSIILEALQADVRSVKMKDLKETNRRAAEMMWSKINTKNTKNYQGGRHMIRMRHH